MVIGCGAMKSHTSHHGARNSEPVYEAKLPSRLSALPSTERRIIAGVETTYHRSQGEGAIFGREVRHYNMIARGVSAPAVALSPYNAAELKGAVLLACGDESVDVREGIPSITRGACFRVARSADLFFGGTIKELSPGKYMAGDTVVDSKLGRIYLELLHDNKLSFAVIGLFTPGRVPSCVDWRVLERI